MKAVLWIGLVVAMSARPARADSVAWGGQIGRFSVHDVSLGFQDGRGVGGWAPDDVRDFASWAGRYAAALPNGIGVSVDSEEGVPKHVQVHRCAGADLRCERPVHSDELDVEQLSGTSLASDECHERLVAILERETGTKRRAAPAPRSVFTVELFASTSRRTATRAAARLAGALEEPTGQMYYLACMPCSIPVVRVIEGTSRPKETFRVVVGNFEDKASAARALRGLRPRQLFRGARVRSL